MAETRAARFSPKITFSAIEALYWMSMSMAPFQVLFLQSRGLDSVATGQVMAVISLIGVVMPSLWGFASDRLRSIKRVMIFCILTTALLRLLIPVMSWSPLGNSTLEVGLLLVMTLFQVGMTPLLDAWLVSLIQRHGAHRNIQCPRPKGGDHPSTHQAQQHTGQRVANHIAQRLGGGAQGFRGQSGGIAHDSGQ